MALQRRLLRTKSRRGVSQPPRSRAFFLELLLNMLVFAVCAVVVLQVFVQSKISTDESAALTTLTSEAKTLAEAYKTTDGTLRTLADYAFEDGFSRVYNEGGSLVCYYNSDLEPSSAETARYSLVLMPVEGENDLVNVIQVTAYRGEDDIFGFAVTQYQPQEGR